MVCATDRAPDYILINEYCPGQGILPHQVTVLYECFCALCTRAILSLIRVHERSAGVPLQLIPPPHAHRMGRCSGHSWPPLVCALPACSGACSCLSGVHEMSGMRVLTSTDRTDARRFYRHMKTSDVSGPRRASFCLVLQPRSLVVFSAQAYTHYLHGISDMVVTTL